MKTFLWALLIVSRAACPSVCFDRQGIRSRLYNGRAPPIPLRPPSRASTCLTSPAQRRRSGAPDGVFEALGRGLAPGLGPECQRLAPDERDLDPARFQQPPEMGPQIHGAVPGDARTQAPVERQAVEPGIGDGERLYPDFAGDLAQGLAGRNKT